MGMLCHYIHGADLFNGKPVAAKTSFFKAAEKNCPTAEKFAVSFLNPN